MSHTQYAGHYGGETKAALGADAYSGYGAAARDAEQMNQSACTPVRDNGIEHKLNLLEKLTAELHSSIANLNMRLLPVRPNNERPCPPEEVAKRMPSFSAVGERLTILNEDVHRAIRRLNDLTGEIDL